jgi:predicted ArsR family transcriptional regulator
VRAAAEGITTKPEALQKLDHRARVVLALFARTEQITAADVAHTLGIAARTARLLLATWVGEGWLEVANPSKRARAYRLSASYRQVIGKLSASYRQDKG